MLETMPTALMVFAALAWLRAGTTGDRSDDLELLLACLMLNAAALVLWNALHGSQRMLALWAPQAAAAGLFNLLVHGLRQSQPAPVAAQRAAWHAGALALTALALAVFLPPVQAQDATPQAPQPEELPLIPVQSLSEETPAVPPLAEPPEAELSPVVVVATRTPRAVAEVAASVAVVSERDIETRQASSLGEALRDLAGVATEGGPRANAEFINVRGLSGPRVLLVVDGARQNFLGGHRSSLMVEPELLKQVELLRGPASALWGSDALGGVVVLSTRDAADFLEADEPFALRWRTAYESAAQETLGSGIAAARWGDFDVVGSLSQRDSDDYRLGGGETQPHSALHTLGSLAKLSWRPEGSPHQLGFIQQGFRQSGQSPSNPAEEVSDTNPLIDRRNDDRYTILRYGFSSSSADSGLRAAQLNLYRDDLLLREDRVDAPRADRTYFRTEGGSGHVTLPSAWGLGDETLWTLGAEIFRDRAQATRDGAPRPQYPDAERRLGGVFLQSELARGDVTIVPGVRYDRYEAESHSDAARAIRESAVSPKLGLAYRVSEGLHLRAGYNAAFRAPGLIEIYAAGQHFLGNEFVPNPELRPEQARNLELGFSLDQPAYGPGQLLLSGSIYRNRVRDFIELFVDARSELLAPQCLPPQPAVGCVNRNDDGSANLMAPPIFVDGTTSSRNLPSATLTGGELEAAYAWGPLKLGLSYSRVRGESDQDGAALTSMPADRLRSTLNLKLRPSLQSTLCHSHSFAQDRVPLKDDGTPVVPRTPAFSTWDWSASWEPTVSASAWGLRDPRLVLGVDNLTDEAYRDHLNILRSPGRNLRISLSAGF